MPIIGERFVLIPHYLRTVISDGAYVTYAALLEYAWAPSQPDEGGGTYLRAESALAESRGLSVRTVIRHIRELERIGAITVERRGKRRTNVITICPWDQIMTASQEGDDSSSLFQDVTQVAMHIGGDLTQVSRMTCHDCQIHIEEDPQKQTPPTQEDHSQSLWPQHSAQNSAQVDARALRDPSTPPDRVASAVGPGGPPLGDSWDERPGGPFWGPGELEAVWWVDVFELKFVEGLRGNPLPDELSAAYDRLWDLVGSEVAQREVEALCQLHPRDLDSALGQMLALLEQVV
jgi:hypothetical protein